MHRNPGYFAIILSGVTAVLLTACKEPMALGDQGAPGGVSGVEVAKKCRKMDFNTDAGNSSGTLDLKSDGTVLVTMHPAEHSINWKLKHLASSKGRIIARVVNTGTGDWPLMALAPSDTACWHVWIDGNDIVRAQWVGLNNDANPNTEPLVQADKGFEIMFHDRKHDKDQSEWNKPDVFTLEEPRDIFRLASFQQELLRTGNTGWTTCLVNGCCRSRQ